MSTLGFRTCATLWLLVLTPKTFLAGQTCQKVAQKDTSLLYPRHPARLPRSSGYWPPMMQSSSEYCLVIFSCRFDLFYNVWREEQSLSSVVKQKELTTSHLHTQLYPFACKRDPNMLVQSSTTVLWVLTTTVNIVIIRIIMNSNIQCCFGKIDCNIPVITK